MTDRIELDGIDYWVSYTYEKEEISHDHYCPARVSIVKVVDEFKAEVNDKDIIDDLETMLLIGG